MKEFKGTRQKLEPKYVSGVCIGIGTIEAFSMITANSIIPDTDEEYEKQKQEIEANMRLYSAARELLEALQGITHRLKLADKIYPLDKAAIKKAELVINKALGL